MISRYPCALWEKKVEQIEKIKERNKGEEYEL